MQPIHTLLQLLDQLYHSDLAEYENALQAVAQQIERHYPGFTIAIAEIYTFGAERNLHGGMRHVLVPASSVE